MPPVLAIADRFEVDELGPLPELKRLPAFDTLLERTVHVTVFPASLTTMLTGWARQVQALEVDALITPEQLGLLDDGRPYLVQPPRVGQTLNSLRRTISGADRASVLADAIAVLADIHAAGLAHGSFDDLHILLNTHGGGITSYLEVEPPASVEAANISTLYSDLTAALALVNECLEPTGKSLPSDATLADLEMALRVFASRNPDDVVSEARPRRDRLEQLLRATTELSLEVTKLSNSVQVGSAIVTLALEVVDASESLICRLDRGAGVPWVATHETWMAEELSDAIALVLADHTPRMVVVRRQGESQQRWAMIVLLTSQPSSALVVASAPGQQAYHVSDLDQLGTFAATAGLVLSQFVSFPNSNVGTFGMEVLDALPLGVMMTDLSNVITSMNRHAAAILAVPQMEAIGSGLQTMEVTRLLGNALSREGEIDRVMVPVPSGRASVSIRRLSERILFTIERVGMRATRSTSASYYRFNDIVGSSECLQKVLAEARLASAGDISVLITGDSGTGKEMLAQAIHGASERSQGPFVPLNVAAIPGELLESELFGYERGAFTGARNNGMPGKFELAHGGTLLLDEIGDMPFALQAKLLRVLQEKRVQRLGSTRDFPIDVRVISTTHAHLREAVDAGRFRLDLFFRLCVVHLHLPALRERIGDLDELMRHHLAASCARAKRPLLRVADHVMHALRRHAWPGNIRELSNMTDTWSSLVPLGQEWIDELPRNLSPSVPDEVLDGTHTPIPVEPLSVVEQRAICRAIEAFDGNLSQAARALGVSRGTLYNKLSRYREGEIPA